MRAGWADFQERGGPRSLSGDPFDVTRTIVVWARKPVLDSRSGLRISNPLTSTNWNCAKPRKLQPLGFAFTTGALQSPARTIPCFFEQDRVLDAGHAAVVGLLHPVMQPNEDAVKTRVRSAAMMEARRMVSASTDACACRKLQ